MNRRRHHENSLATPRTHILALAGSLVAVLVFVLLAAPAVAHHPPPPMDPHRVDLPVAPIELPAVPVSLFDDPAEVGRWLEPFEGEQAAVSMALLASGNILYWDAFDIRDLDITAVPFVTDAPAAAGARVLDLSGPTPVVRTPMPEDGGGEDIFCAGHALLADGRVVIAGGNRYGTYMDHENVFLWGVTQTLLFHDANETFTQAADMNKERWYPTVLTLDDGSAMVVGGADHFGGEFGSGSHLASSEIYDPDADEWTGLPVSAENVLPVYPHVFQLPSGPYAGQIAYVPGGCERARGEMSAWSHIQTLDLDAMTWTQHDAMAQYRDCSSPVMLLLRPGEDHRARVLSVGGKMYEHPWYYEHDQSIATPETHLFDFNQVSPTANPGPPMTYARWNAHSVLLPTGEVLAVGGTMTGNTYSAPIVPVPHAELLDPAAVDDDSGLPGAWRTVAPAQVTRGYHSTALLLPDGRVLTGGHVPAPFPNVGGPLTATYETRFEIFEPPYLFRGERPVIEDAPDSLGYGEPFAVATAQAGIVTRAVLMRLGTVTHALDTGQRGIELEEVSRDDATLQFRAPPDAFIAPPGHYMLFLLADHGDGEVPSVAQILTLDTSRETADGETVADFAPGAPLVLLLLLVALAARFARRGGATRSN